MKDFESFVAHAAAALSPFDYSIRSTFHQATGERIWALINATSDPLTQLATVRNADELAYIKRLLDLTFEENNSRRKELMAFNGMQATNARQAPTNRQRESRSEDGDSPKAVRSSINSLTISHAEKLLGELVQEGWFERSREGFYTLSPRALLELKAWLVEAYNSEEAEEGDWQRIKNCVACKEIVTVGQRCQERECNVRLHNHCLEVYWRSAGRRAGGAGPSTQGGAKTCPCGKEWTGKCFVGERVVTEDPKWKEKRGRGKRGAVVMEEEDEEDEVDEDKDEDLGLPPAAGGDDEDEDEDADGDAEDDDE